ncbi:hypothetical protein [Flavobacterium sp. CAN_S2]|uniref:hypothetical protein n=1 Tax=Flavobacterium sp. CAN_S2 TaxID=2787726 RepID=UPI0018C9047B
MKTTLVIKDILLPKLEKDFKFSAEQVDSVFWKKFTTDLVHFEEDAKPLYALIYSLELDNPEKIIDKLPNIYTQFLKELAECYVLGQTSEATNYLLKTNNEAFFKEVQFLQTMQQAIKSVERKRIKTDLPKSYERLTFELSDADLANTIKKKGREDLKEKFKQWDDELEKEKRPLIYYSLSNERDSKPKPKVISLSWMKYASIAAIFIIGFMIWQPNKLSNDELFSQYNSQGSIIQSIDYQKMATVSESEGVRGVDFLFQNYTKSETNEAMAAIALFKNNNFEKSKQILIALSPKEKKNNQLLLFLAITQLKTNEVNEAVSNLECLNAISNYEFSDEAKFHLALGYIKQNEKKKAKDLLVALVTNDSKYSMPSQEILDKMRWF